MATIRKSTPIDPAMGHLLPGPSNDDLIAQQEAAEKERAAKGYPRVEMGADAEDKATDGFGDLDYDPFGLTDPLTGLKQEYERPGFALKLLSDDVNNRLGRRGYRIVKDQNGDPVRCGKMVLGEIPERHAAARRRAPIVKSNEELALIKDAQRDAVDKLRSDAKDMGLQVLEAGDRVSDSRGRGEHDMGLRLERGIAD